MPAPTAVSKRPLPKQGSILRRDSHGGHREQATDGVSVHDGPPRWASFRLPAVPCLA